MEYTDLWGEFFSIGIAFAADRYEVPVRYCRASDGDASAEK
jgi:hypothetical protein